MIFEGMKICILSGFSGFTKLSSEVIKRNIEKHSGTVVSYTKPDFNLDELTCLIVPENAQLSKILELLNISNLPICPIVSPAWAIESYQKKHVQSFENYSYLNLSLPTKRPLSPHPSKTVSKSQPHSPKTSSPDIQKHSNNELYLRDHTLKPEFLENKEKYAFSQTQGTNLNEHITSVLEILMNNYFLLKDKARAFAYRFAIATLKSHPEKITCFEQAQNLTKIGEKIRKKIEEILETGSLKRVKAMEDLERLRSMKEFTSIWGVGGSTASKLYSIGYRKIDDLKKNIPDILNENQRTCLELFEELEQKIPRNEVKEISDLVVEEAKNLLCDRDIISNTCGSYRRGKEFCGDIDVLITFDSILEDKMILSKLVDRLKERGIVTHVLVLSDDIKKHENFTFSGIAKIENGIHRRLDIKIYPKKIYAWALMHFTGSASFNRSIRLFAKNKGLKLTDEGLFPAFRNGSETTCGGNLVVCYTEEDIFKLFDMPYKPPEERDI